MRPRRPGIPCRSRVLSEHASVVAVLQDVDVHLDKPTVDIKYSVPTDWRRAIGFE